MQAKERLLVPKDSREFIPHITLCRLSGAGAPGDFYKLRFRASFKAEKLFLIRSELRSSGARYSDVFSAPFARSFP
jgi:2'-5' RNA ligase